MFISQTSNTDYLQKKINNKSWGCCVHPLRWKYSINVWKVKRLLSNMEFNIGQGEVTENQVSKQRLKLSIKVLHLYWPFNFVYHLKCVIIGNPYVSLMHLNFIINSLPRGVLSLINIKQTIHYYVKPRIHQRRNYWDWKYCREFKEGETQIVFKRKNNTVIKPCHKKISLVKLSTQ